MALYRWMAVDASHRACEWLSDVVIRLACSAGKGSVRFSIGAGVPVDSAPCFSALLAAIDEADSQAAHSPPEGRAQPAKTPPEDSSGVEGHLIDELL